MNRELQDDPDTLERYLRRQLSPEEEAQFEARYLSDAALLDDLELSQKLHEGFKDMATVDARHESPAPRRNVLAWLRSPQYAAAATVLLLGSVAISTALYQRVEDLSAPQLAGTFTDTRLVPLMTTRGAGDHGPNIRTTAGEQLIFLVDPGPEPYPRFRATVAAGDHTDGAEPVWQSDGLTPGYQGMIALAIPSARLPAGTYVVTLEGQPRAGDGDDAGPALVGELHFSIETGR